MNPIRMTIALALQLAARRGGVTAIELSGRAECSLRAAERHLAALAADGVLARTVPVRKGARLGDWRIVYRMAGKGGAKRGS